MLEILTSTQTVLSPEITKSIHDVLNNLLQLAALGLATATAYLVKLWINSLNSKWKQTLATRFVKYAEQTYAENPTKQAFVKTKLKQFFPRLSDEEIDHLIESTVLTLKTELSKPSATPVQPQEVPDEIATKDLTKPE